jgi:hypothetical protein
MNLQDLLANPQIIEQLAASAGIGQQEAATGLEALLPAVTQGLARSSRGATGLEGLAKALGSGGHQRYLDQPQELADPRTRLDGNAILGHIFGSKDVSRNVAGHAAQSTGLSSTVLKSLLPIVASVAMAALSKQTQGGAQIQTQNVEQPEGGGADLLGSLLGGLMGAAAGGSSANDSPLDDVLDLPKKFL